MQKIEVMKQKQDYSTQMETQIKQTHDTQVQMARLDKELALKQQEERIKSLMKKEQENRRMRFEWRKSLEDGY